MGPLIVLSFYKKERRGQEPAALLLDWGRGKQLILLVNGVRKFNGNVETESERS